MKALRILINWFFILTLPLWAGFVMAGSLISDCLKGRGPTELTKCMKGEQWIWSYFF
jgi:hypothetical protein